MFSCFFKTRKQKRNKKYLDLNKTKKVDPHNSNSATKILEMRSAITVEIWGTLDYLF